MDIEKETMLMLTLALTGHSDCVEAIEKLKQAEATSNAFMAKEMEPNKIVWEKIGFKFEDIPGDDVLVKATLPEGWRIEAVDGYWRYMYDSLNNKRGSMFYKGVFYDRKANMFLFKRYRICTKYFEDNSKEIYFGNDDEVLYSAGKVDGSLSYKENYEKSYELEKMCEKYASMNFPDWENVDAYWDKPMEKTIGVKDDK